ncbi:MAG: TauD/TfdA family dioxygenase [Pseudomonadota bacterium]
MKLHPTGRFDNSASDYQHIEAVPLAAAMGAEIRGVNLAALSAPQFSEIEHALFRHKMIFFRAQTIHYADQESFSLRFGPFAEDAYTKGVDGYPDVQPVIKEADDAVPIIFGSCWHTDSPFLETPPAISMLYGVDIPPYGGDTIWANSVLAYELLSDKMKEVIAPLRVRFSMGDVVETARKIMPVSDSPLGRLAATSADTVDSTLQRKIDGAAHPLVRTHPVSGEKSLYIDENYAECFEGMTIEESRPLLDYLVGHLVQPALQCRLRWEPKTLALWDNRICVHQAFNDYDGFRREMYRTTIAGEQPS